MRTPLPREGRPLTNGDLERMIAAAERRVERRLGTLPADDPEVAEIIIRYARAMALNEMFMPQTGEPYPAATAYHDSANAMLAELDEMGTVLSPTGGQPAAAAKNLDTAVPWHPDDLGFTDPYRAPRTGDAWDHYPWGVAP